MPEDCFAVQPSRWAVPFCTLNDPWYLKRHPTFSAAPLLASTALPRVIVGSPWLLSTESTMIAAAVGLTVELTRWSDPHQPSTWKRLLRASYHFPALCPWWGFSSLGTMSSTCRLESLRKPWFEFRLLLALLHVRLFWCRLRISAWLAAWILWKHPEGQPSLAL